jgi:hypothetical protein
MRHSERFVPQEEGQVMNEEVIEIIKRMRVVTISREYGSGGGEIATRSDSFARATVLLENQRGYFQK